MTHSDEHIPPKTYARRYQAKNPFDRRHMPKFDDLDGFITALDRLNDSIDYHREEAESYREFEVYDDMTLHAARLQEELEKKTTLLKQSNIASFINTTLVDYFQQELIKKGLVSPVDVSKEHGFNVKDDGRVTYGQNITVNQGEHIAKALSEIGVPDDRIIFNYVHSDDENDLPPMQQANSRAGILSIDVTRALVEGLMDRRVWQEIDLLQTHYSDSIPLIFPDTAYRELCGMIEKATGQESVRTTLEKHDWLKPERTFVDKLLLRDGDVKFPSAPMKSRWGAIEADIARKTANTLLGGLTESREETPGRKQQPSDDLDRPDRGGERER